jgi:hypothetical protein
MSYGSNSVYLYLDQDDQFPSSVLHFTGYRGYVELDGTDQTVAGLDCTHATSAKSAFIQNYEDATTSTLTIDNDEDYTYVGGLRESGGTLAVVKKGTGTQSLLGGNSASYMDFSGGLTVENGTLDCDINARTNFASDIVVKSPGVLDVADWTGFNIPSGKSLGGDGSVVGDVLAAAGSSIEPGQSIGSLEIDGDMDLVGTLVVEYDTNENTIDVLEVTGELDLTSGTIDFDLYAGSGSLAPGIYVFATYGTLTWDSENPPSEVDVPSGFTVDYAYGGNSIALVPEPATIVLLALGLLGLAVYARRRRY